MKFLFKEMIQVYEDHLAGETQDSLISVWFLREGRVCTSLLRLKREVSSPFTMPLYEITWLLYQLYHLGPITSATDEPA